MEYARSNRCEDPSTPAAPPLRMTGAVECGRYLPQYGERTLSFFPYCVNLQVSLQDRRFRSLRGPDFLSPPRKSAKKAAGEGLYCALPSTKATSPVPSRPALSMMQHRYFALRMIALQKRQHSSQEYGKRKISAKHTFFQSSRGFQKGKRKKSNWYTSPIRFPLWPSGESEDHTEGPRRLFGYFLAGEKVSRSNKLFLIGQFSESCWCQDPSARFA